MTNRINTTPQINLDRALQEGPTLAERATQVAIQKLGTKPAHAPVEEFYLKQAWNNLKASLAGFSTYGIMSEIESSLASPTIQIEHFEQLAKKLNFDTENLSVDQLPLGIYSFAHLSEDVATRALWTALGKIIQLPKLEKLDEIKAWFNDPANTQLLNTIEKLDLSGKGLKVLPPPLVKLTHLKVLLLANNELNYIPDWLGENLVQLEALNLSKNLFHEIPESITYFSKLKTFCMNDNKISSISKGVCELKNLTVLSLSGTRISEIPKEIAQLSKLETLMLASNQITKIPKVIGALTELKYLNLNENEIGELPEAMSQLKQLATLELAKNKFTKVPKVIWLLDSLISLSLPYNEISEIPSECRYLTHLDYLNLNNNKITKISEDICRLAHLEILSLENNQLTEIPEHIGNFVAVLALNNNKLELLPKCWSNPGKIEVLSLENNPIKDIPEDLPRSGQRGDMSYSL